MAKTDRDYEREAAKREFDYFQEQDEKENWDPTRDGSRAVDLEDISDLQSISGEHLGAKRTIEHTLPGRGPADDEASLAQPYSDGPIIGKGLGPQDRFR